MKTTGKYSVKPYECTECGNEIETGTNHWGECYPFCKVCGKHTPHMCTEEVPEGYGTPEPWKMVKLEDVCEIIEIKGVKV